MATQIKEMSKDACKTLRSALQQAVANVEKEYGIAIHVGNATYESTSVRFKVECSVVDASGMVQTSEASMFQRMAGSYNLEPSDLGKVFAFREEQYKIIGCKPRCKQPIIAERVEDGAKFKFSADIVKTFLDKAANK